MRIQLRVITIIINLQAASAALWQVTRTLPQAIMKIHGDKK